MVTIEQLVQKYPRLWHMADPRNLPGILARGLLATSTLLELLAVDDAMRIPYERERRAEDVEIRHDEYGLVVLRDQKPLSVARLERVLTEDSVGDFLAFVNRRVFFWPTVERLTTMSSARAYRDRSQLVLVVCAAPMLRTHVKKLLLSRINSGATMPYAAQRSIATFQQLENYDWSGGKRHVAEITIEDGVSDIWSYVERLEEWRNGEFVKTLSAPYEEGLVDM